MSSALAQMFRAVDPGHSDAMSEINNPFKNDEVAAVAPAGTGNAVVDALQASTFDVVLLAGPTDTEAIDIEGDGLGASIVRFFQQGEELDTLRHFKERLAEGDDVVRVIGVGERADEAAQIIVDNGGETVWHYGKWTYRKLR